MIIVEKDGGLVKLTNLYTFKKSPLMKGTEKRDMRKKVIKSDRATYSSTRIKKGLDGLKFASYIPTNLEISQLSDYTVPKTLSINPEPEELTLKELITLNYNIPIIKSDIRADTLSKDYKSMSLELLIKEENLPIYISSGHRPGAKTKQGKVSHHSRTDSYGNSMAYDILPYFNGKIDKSQNGFLKMQLALLNSEGARKWFKEHGFGILDESTAEMLKRTGGTGAHYHIGPDLIARQGMNSLLSKYGLLLIAYALKGLKFAFYLPAEDIPQELYLLSPYDYLSEYSYLKETPYKGLLKPVYVSSSKVLQLMDLDNKKKLDMNTYRHKYEGKLLYDQFINEVDRVFPDADNDFKDWLAYTAKNESGFDWNALNKHSTARGAFLILASTAKGAGMKNYSIDELLKGAKHLYDSYKRRADKYKDWIEEHGYSYRGALSALHYIGLGNFDDLVAGKPLRAPKGVNRELLERILRGEEYSA